MLACQRQQIIRAVAQRAPYLGEVHRRPVPRMQVRCSFKCCVRHSDRYSNIRLPHAIRHSTKEIDMKIKTRIRAGSGYIIAY